MKSIRSSLAHSHQKGPASRKVFDSGILAYFRGNVEFTSKLHRVPQCAVARAEEMAEGEARPIQQGDGCNAKADIFRRGLCLPSDNKMAEEQQSRHTY